MLRSRLVVGLVLCLLVSGLAYVWWHNDRERGVWRFNFAPAGSPAVSSFVPVGGNTAYHPSRGYGWLDLDGPLVSGKWPPDKGTSWESRHGINLIARPGPDDLARSFAEGRARFVVDLAPGRYQVWLLSGDAGRFEHTPWQPYSLRVEGREVYRYQPGAAQYHRQFDTPVAADDLSDAAVWQRYIEPRFVWSRVELEISDGRLEVELDGIDRDRSRSGLAGDYPYTEHSRGPGPRYSGALNALVIVALDGDGADSAELIDEIDSWRRNNFRDKWPLVDAAAAPQGKPAPDGVPYHVYIPAPGEAVPVFDPLPHQPDAGIARRAGPGQTVSFSLALHPLIALGETRVSLSELHGAAGALETAEQLEIGVVRLAARAAPGRERGWQPAAGEIVPTDRWDLPSGINRQFQLNYRVPEDLAPGRYRGIIRIEPENAVGSEVEVELEVLPLRLQRPEHLALGMTYFSPVQDAWFDEERFWQRLAAEFRDMRRLGFTTVQYTGIGIHDYDRLDRVMAIYRETGFPRPLVLLESYGAMDRLRRDGIAWNSEAFFPRYRRSIADLLQQASQRQWPPLIINFGDEFTNSALEEFGARVARDLKQIPGIVTSADTNGYKEVKLLAPEVDILVFNNGWAGPDRVNGDRKLLNQATVELIRAAGAEPWLVNVGTDRFSNGYWLWKMVGLGVRGKLEWIYRSYKAMPHNPFDGDPLRHHLVYPGPDATVLHTLEYERLRMGLDDLAYLYTLEQMLAEKRQHSGSEPAVAAAETFLRKLDAAIDDDFNTYLDDETRRWPAQRFDSLRNQVIDLILGLQRLPPGSG